MPNTSHVVLAGALLALPLAAQPASSEDLPVVAEPVEPEAVELTDKEWYERCGDAPELPAGTEKEVLEGLIEDLGCLEWWFPRLCVINPQGNTDT